MPKAEPDSNSQTQVEVHCPNCDLITPAVYDTAEKRPSIYGTCPFCHTMWRWRKCSTVEVIPAERKTYAYDNRGSAKD